MAFPVSLEEARRQIKLEADDQSQDGDLTIFLADAVSWVEQYTGHLLSAREVTETFLGFGPVELRAWPIKPDAVPGVAYIDASGAPVAITGARLDLSRSRARVMPGDGRFWPFHDAEQVFTVTIQAGYAEDEAIPGNMRRAILMLVGAFDADREGGEVFTRAEAAARKLCGSYRNRRL